MPDILNLTFYKALEVREVERCRCPESHSTCANGHKYHRATSKGYEVKADGRKHLVAVTYYWIVDEGKANTAPA